MEEEPHANGHAKRTLEVVIQGSSEVVEIALEDIENDITSLEDIKDLFQEQRAPPHQWVKVAEEYWNRTQYQIAIQFIQMGVHVYRADRNTYGVQVLLCVMATQNLALSRNQPKKILIDARADIINNQETKEHYWAKAVALLNEAEKIDNRAACLLDAKGALYLAQGKMDDALRVFDNILQQFPTHVIALLGKARLLYLRRQYRAAVKLYQAVLRSSPNILPDPRIGIGLCYWGLGDQHMARKAWLRSMEVNPGINSSSAALLLGLSHLNTSRPSIAMSDEERVEEYGKGINYIQQAWACSKTIASAASVLASHFLKTQTWDTAIKLAERAVQYADGKAVMSDGHLMLARALHGQGDSDAATKNYVFSHEAQPDQIQAACGIGQMLLLAGNLPAALNTFGKVLAVAPKTVEALVNIGSIHFSQSLAAMSSGDAAKERSSAKEYYDQVARMFSHATNGTNGDGPEISPRVLQVAEDPEFYIEIARLNLADDSVKALSALRQSARISEPDVSPQLLNNIACLLYGRKSYEEAQEMLERALTVAGQQMNDIEGSSKAKTTEADMFTFLYNLGVCYEALGEKDQAQQIYEQRILIRHPEHHEAKARLAAILLSQKHYDRAHDLLKQALTAQPNNLELRSLYTYFLSETAQPQLARDFAMSTLKEQSKHDVYALSASGIFYYHLARENKNTSHEAAKDRAGKYLRSAELFEKALQLDSKCAIAAQGLAIILAENALGTGVAPSQMTAQTETAARVKNTRDALGIFMKVRESLNDANVYVNLGHCHFSREEWERACESYDTASKRFYNQQNISVLLYLARAQFFRANKNQSFASIQASKTSCQAAYDLSPKDDSILYNLGLILQKGLELLLDLPPARRRLTEIEAALNDATRAQEIFGTLADKKEANLPYQVDIAHQRRRYGENLLKRSEAIMKDQAAYENTEAAKIEQAKQERELENERIHEIERARKAELQRQAEALAEQRKQMLEDSRSWYVKPEKEESDGEGKEKKKRGPRKKKEDAAFVAGDDEDVEMEQSKKKKGRKPKRPKEIVDEDEQPAEDDDEEVRPSKKSKKQYKSKEIISDDEE